LNSFAPSGAHAAMANTIMIMRYETYFFNMLASLSF
jgi:hypothetical protein